MSGWRVAGIMAKTTVKMVCAVPWCWIADHHWTWTPVGDEHIRHCTRCPAISRRIPL